MFCYALHSGWGLELFERPSNIFKAIQFSVSIVSMSKTVLFLAIQFSISTQFKYQNSYISSYSVEISKQFSSIWPIDRTQAGATTPGQCGPGSDGNEGVLRISQSSIITGTLPSDCLVSYPEHSLGGLTPLQSVYFTPPAEGQLNL